MNNKQKIINQHIKLISELKKHNNLYFNQDNPQISDADYDRIKLKALELEKKYPYLKSQDSIEKIVGTSPSNKFRKIKHLIPMLSLSNSFEKKIW